MSLTLENGVVVLDHNSSQVASPTMNLKAPIVTLPAAANTTITAAQSGTTFVLPQATASNTITLPAAAAGLRYEFVVGATADGSHTQTISSPSANINGQMYSIPGACVITAISAKTNIIVSATAANVKLGDRIVLISDGTNYYASIFSVGTAALATFS